MKRATIGAALLLVGVVTIPASAQNRSTFILGGYGTTTYEGATTDGFPNDFSASVSPVILYSMGRDILFETELEFGLTGASTTTALEYAQIDYLGFENWQIIAGKFLVPFGVFGERIHPTWINKLPSRPVLFGHGHGGVAEAGLLPILMDAGAMVRWAKPVGTNWAIDFSGYVTQGPRLAAAEMDEEPAHAMIQASLLAEVPEHGDETPAPAVAFGTSFTDNNKNKMLGARLGLVKGPSFEIYASGFHAMYDEGNFLSFKGEALSVEWRRSGFEFRGEAVATQQEFQGADDFEVLNRSGFYAQVSKRYGPWEPVMRWGTLADGTVDGAETIAGHNEFALGLDYWLEPTVPLKFAWEFHQDRDDRFYIQWAYGF